MEGACNGAELVRAVVQLNYINKCYILPILKVIQDVRCTSQGRSDHARYRHVLNLTERAHTHLSLTVEARNGHCWSNDLLTL